MLNHLLIAVAALAGYCLLVLAVPMHPCFRCRGRRVITRGRRARPCRWCRATGLQPWPAGRLVHRLAWTILLSHLMERRRERKDT